MPRCYRCTKRQKMGVSLAILVAVISSCLLVTGSEDVELKDPHLLEVATFGATSLLKDPELELENFTLQRIMDSQVVPQAPPAPTFYLLTLEMGPECESEDCSDESRKICEITILDEPLTKKMSVLEGKTECRTREPDEPLVFSPDTDSSIARSIPLDTPETKKLVNNAIIQMTSTRGGKHSLKQIGQARKVMMEESNSNLYYLSLYISTVADDSISEVCEVTMEENLSSKDQTLQSLRCFGTGDGEGAARLGIVPIASDDLASGLVRSAILASLAVIDAESRSQFQLKVIGYSVADTRASVDSGTRDIDMKLGLVPTLCIKHPETDEDEPVIRSCPIDNERAPSICSITLTQWPWVADGYLFSDLECQPTNYTVISDDLEAYADDEAQSSSESGLEVEEVEGNAVQASNRDGEEEEDEEEEESAEEEPVMKKRAPCAGCPAELDPEDDAVIGLAAYSLEAIEEAANSDKVQVLERVVKATSQVVAGIKYEVTVETSDSTCKRGANVERANCEADSAGSRRICTVTLLDQPWIGPKQILEIGCEEPQVEAESRSLKTGSKPSLGGLTPLAADDEEVQNMALFALDSLDNFDDNSQKRVLVRVLEAGYQVVAGKLYKMKIELALANCPENNDAADPSCRTNQRSASYVCDVQVLAQPWTDEPKRLVDSKCLPAEEKASAPLEKRILSTPKVGGVSPADSDEDYVQEIARYATVAINQRSNDDSSVKLLRVLQAKTQTVAGKNVFLDVEVGYTTCAKGQEAKSADECNLDESRSSLVCHVTVWDRPWLNERQVTDLSCDEDALDTTAVAQDETTTEPLVTDTIKVAEMDESDGTPKPVDAVDVSTPTGRAEADDPLDAEIQGYAEFALAVIEEQSSPEVKLIILKILASSIQSVDEAKNIQLTLEIGQTGCSQEEVSSGRCRGADLTRSLQICNIQMRKLMQETEVINLQCQPKAKKSRSAFASEDIDESPFVGYAPESFRLGGEFNFEVEARSNVQPDAPPKLCAGCYSSANVEDEDVKEMASFAANFISQSSNSGPLRLVRVTAAEKQVVAGLNYKLTIELGGNNSSLTCQVVVFNQPWTSTVQVTSSECQDSINREVSDQNEPAMITAVQAEPEAAQVEEPDNKKFLCSGCYQSASVDDADVQEIASFAATSISQSSNSGPLRLVRVTAAEKQVVAGLNYRLTIELSGDGTTMTCQVVVFDQPWTGTRQVTSSACPQSRKRRSASLVGGASPMELNDPKIKELSQFALSTIGQRSNDPNPPNLLRLIKASKQVVSGMLYTLEMEIAPSNCVDGESCRDNSGRQRCSVTIWDQPWTGRREVTKMSCKEASKSILTAAAKVSRQPNGRRVLGGVVPADPHSEEIKSAASFALQTIQAQSNSDNRLDVVTVRNAATQTVSGMNIFLTLEIGETRCRANQTEASDCPFDDQADRQMCKVKIWSRPWLGDRQVLESKCKPLSITACKWKNCNKRFKRQLKLGKEGKEPKRLRYMNAFRSFITKFDRIYKTWAEFEFRYKVYRANQKRIELLTLNEKGTAVYGDTEFSDLTDKEFKERYTGLKPLLRRPGTTLDRAVIPNVQLPNEYDWRNYNVVTPVKNQGQCGSCWAFSVTGNVEGLYGIRHGQLISLSEQELVDCDKLDSGCNGGLPENAYKAIKDLGGLESESDYPYNGHQNKCNLDRNITQVQVTGGVEISKNETEMAQWLIQNGPISIGINANGMQFYRGGVSHPWKVLCRPGGIDHGVLIVGYGVSDYPKFNKTLPYWIVKNSWGTGWGEQGYYRVYRGDGTCGLNEMATSAVVE